MAVYKLLKAAEFYHSGHAGLFFLHAELCALENLKKILADGLFHENGLWILGQDCNAAVHLNFTAVGLAQAADNGKCGSLSRSVSAENSQELTLLHLKGQAFNDVGHILLVAEPYILHGDGCFLRAANIGRGYNGHQFMLFAVCGQPIAAVANGYGAG